MRTCDSFIIIIILNLSELLCSSSDFLNSRNVEEDVIQKFRMEKVSCKK